MKVQYHTPDGVVTVDTETVTDEELAELGITREDLPISTSFTPGNPIQGVELRLTIVENFLKGVYP